MRSFRDYLNHKEEVLNEGLMSWIGKRLRNMIIFASMIALFNAASGNYKIEPLKLVDKVSETIPIEITNEQDFNKAVDDAKKTIEDEIKKPKDATYDYHKGDITNQLPNACGEVMDNVLGSLVNKYKIFKYGLIDGIGYGASSEEKQAVEEKIEQAEENVKKGARIAADNFNRFNQKHDVTGKTKKGAQIIKKGVQKGVEKAGELKK